MARQFDELIHNEQQFILHAQKQAKFNSAGELVFDHAFAERAKCKGEDRATFFPPKGHGINPARRICKGCPVRMDCLYDSLTTRCSTQFGVYGGMSPDGREVLASRLGIIHEPLDPVSEWLGYRYWGVNAEKRSAA